MGCVQILPVDWEAITALGATETNYQLLPGDRVFIAEDRLVAADTWVSKLVSPVERIFGFTLLGTQTVSNLRFFKQQGQRGFAGF
jgi:polysaccharide export outer membrane protein